MRGPPPKPTKLKQLAGNPGRRPLNAHEPQPSGTAQRPDWLPLGARLVWDQYAPLLTRVGLLTAADADTFGRWCSLASEFRSAPADMPASKIARMDALEQRFGLDPSSRSRISVEPITENDEERFFGTG